MRKLIKKVLFGRRRNYSQRTTKPNSITFDNQRRINDLDSKLSNLMRHLKVETLGNSNFIGDKKDAKKFNRQWN